MYLRYFRSVLRHKWFVFLECCKLGIPWLGVIHDLSKFLPSEFIPYARWFYDRRLVIAVEPNGFKRGDTVRLGNYDACYVVVEPGATLELLPKKAGDAFDVAWLHHQHRNKHHWQRWRLVQGSDPDKILPMPDKYRKEMVADWRGAGLAYKQPDTPAWYQGHRDKMQLHPETRAWIEKELT